MGWNKVDGQKLGMYAHSVRVAGRRSNRTASSLILTVSVGHAICQQLGWNRDMRADIYIGEGKHEGRIKIVHSDSGRMKLCAAKHTKRGGLFFNVSRLPESAKLRTHPSEPVMFFISPDGSLEVKLPDWLFESPELKVAA